ncbi:hypothetical protein PHLCEN_2v4880 [Hermanssonia centrifuga]|uniref:Uncharacterized protein n=1 Tax=Hermanssonia centrifuga TaxID=98765 RepID=A0A2R6PG37_9APHY|nr:hypothetical protein PHLCEN_2v4880 [Hermanssonia centrifuga]
MKFSQPQLTTIALAVRDGLLIFLNRFRCHEDIPAIYGRSVRHEYGTVRQLAPLPVGDCIETFHSFRNGA